MFFFRLFNVVISSMLNFNQFSYHSLLYPLKQKKIYARVFLKEKNKIYCKKLFRFHHINKITTLQI